MSRYGIHLVFGYFVVGMFRSLGFGAAELYLVISQRCASKYTFSMRLGSCCRSPPSTFGRFRSVRAQT